MTTTVPMPKKYLELASERSNFPMWPKYLQPECFGYKFFDWVSPYTKGAHALGGFAFVLQDWASANGLSTGVKEDVQENGRTLNLLTNERLEKLLLSIFGLRICQVYVTNAFPFVKPGGMSSRIPIADVRDAVGRFTLRELEIVQPTFIFALGSVAYSTLSEFEFKVPLIKLPHPAARIGNLAKHELAWRLALNESRVPTLQTAQTDSA